MGDQQQVNDRAVEDVNLWKVVAGAAAHHLPLQGSPVYYLPNLHREAASRGTAGIGPVGQLRRRVAAVVTNFELRANGEDPYVRYQLRVGDGGAQDERLLGQGLDGGVTYHTKRLTASDVSNERERTAYCIMKPHGLPQNLLPPAPAPSSELKSINQPINLVGIQGNQFQLTRIVRFNEGRNIRHYLGGAWNGFKNQNQLMEGDRIAFTRGPATDGALKFGVRRITNGRNPAPPAISVFRVGQMLTVDYYPGRSVGDEYVVLRSAIDRSWMFTFDIEVICNLGEEENGSNIMELRQTRIESWGLDHSSHYFTVRGIDGFHHGVRPWNLRLPEE